MINFLVALTLFGSVSNMEGRIGVRINPDGVVTHVYNIGASARGLIYKDDKILESDYKKGTDNIMGPVGTTVHIKLKRQGQIKEFDIVRVDKSGVKDK